MKKLSKKELECYKEKLLDQVANGEYDDAHYKADQLLVEILDLLGYEELTKIYEKVGKWYD